MSAAPSQRALVAGDRAVLVELVDLVAALGLHERLATLQAGPEAIPGIGDIVPAARTVLVHFDPALITRADLVVRLAAVATAAGEKDAAARDRRLVEIPVVYDGPDLSEVADLLGMDTAALVRLHTGADHTVAFAGFAPGFSYLVGGDPLLDVPRRTTPRVRIPAGSVGLAGSFSGVYPRDSPGGWQLIGSTTLPMWDLTRDPPAALQPGDRVRFVAVAATAATAATVATVAADDRVTVAVRASAAPAPSRGPGLIVQRPGARTLLQDGGRKNVAALGLSAGGALDLPAMRLADRLVGNPEDTAVLEILFGRFRAVARGSVVVAAAGAPVPITVKHPQDAGTTDITDCRPITLHDGDVLTLGAPTSGARTVLAVRGGFDVAPVLGSLSSDTLAGVGPAALARGDVLGIRADGPVFEYGSGPVAWQPLPRDEVTVAVDLGPRDDWFDAASIDRLFEQPWTVSTSADRVGIRLDGAAPLLRTDDSELPSEGVVTGAIQVPPDGRPIVFLADHPLTGGYPVIAAVRRDCLAALAQVTPGMRIRFTRGAAEAAATTP